MKENRYFKIINLAKEGCTHSLGKEMKEKYNNKG